MFRGSYVTPPTEIRGGGLNSKIFAKSVKWSKGKKGLERDFVFFERFFLYHKPKIITNYGIQNNHSTYFR